MRLIDGVKSFLNQHAWIKKYLLIISIVVLLAVTMLVISIVADLIGYELSESNASGGFMCHNLNFAAFTTVLTAFIAVPITAVLIVVYIIQDLTKLFSQDSIKPSYL